MHKFIAAAQVALPPNCALCAGPGGEELVCQDCTADLGAASPACPRCASPDVHGDVCGRCLREPPPFDRTIAIWQYGYPLDELVQALKYGGQLALADWFGRRLATTVAATGDPPVDWIVPLPLAPLRQRERGFNQAAEIARVTARILGIPLIQAGMHRHRETAKQADLPMEARLRNIRGAFTCNLDCTGRHIAVIDDVATTGTTLAEFARTLRAAGAARISNWVVARTPPR